VAKQAKITLRIRFAWWTNLYLYGLYTFCFVTGLRADPDKVVATIIGGIKFEVVHG
jgi:hypothetical protein